MGVAFGILLLSSVEAEKLRYFIFISGFVKIATRCFLTVVT